MGTVTEYDDIIRRAADRWEEIIVDDLPTFIPPPSFDLFAGFFPGAPVVNQVIDDILIGYAVEFLDGPGNTLGRAGPRASVGSRTMAGAMRLDIDDFNRLRNNSDETSLEIITIHELAHTFGIGTKWSSVCGRQCKASTPNFVYNCPHASAEYTALNVPGGTASLLIENDGDSGACGHWEDDSFPDPSFSEIMTGVFTIGQPQILSRVTVGALDDLGGYGNLNYNAADDPPNPLVAEVVLPGFPRRRKPLVPGTSFKLGDGPEGETTIDFSD